MTTEHLAALSDAATQGEWLADGCDIRLVDGPATWGKDEKANVAFITALVNAYRANQIAVIGPDAVERALEKIGVVRFSVTRQENYSGEHREWEEPGYTHPKGSKVIREIVEKTIAALTGRV